MEPNDLSNFDKGALEKHFSEIILKSGPWPRRCRFSDFSTLSSAGHFVLQSGIILAILVKGYERNISMKLF